MTMKFFLKSLRIITPYQILVSGYALITLLGAFLLSLPISSAQGQHQPFIDSLFVAASGISTTGLTPVDIGSFYSKFGQIVLLCIFQIGGIGYMTFFVFLIYVLGIRPPLMTRLVAKESLSGSNLRMLEKFFLVVVGFTFIFEFFGAVILAHCWSKEFTLTRAVYLGIFHSVSAFCTAGFGVFSNSLVGYRDNFLVNLTIIVLSIAGGIGFFVLYDLCRFMTAIFKRKYPRRLSVHSKIVIITTAVVMLTGTILILAAEKWPNDIRLTSRITASAFQAVSASTTDGFNTIDIGAMAPISLTFLMFLMFVGASPGGTGGGVKTTTFGIIICFIWSQLKGKESQINIFKREIPSETVYKAFGILCWFGIIVLLDIIIMSTTEKGSYLQILFEAVSALGNTGLSTGITSSLSDTGKIILIITMFIGRIGPLMAGYFLIGRQKPLLYRYATEDVFVG
jgi:trk system potassium uptake protein TrkH